MPSLLAAARPVYRLYGREDRLNTHINQEPGTHNFFLDNRQALYRVIGDQFYARGDDYPKDEIPSDKEVKTAEQLQVELPKDNADFHSLAIRLMKDLPRDAALPTDKAAAERWRNAHAKQLAELVKAKQYNVQAENAGTSEKGDLRATFLRLRVGNDWTVPAIELVKGNPKETTVVVADGGRGKAVEIIHKLLREGQRVVAVDLFYHGESSISSKDFTFSSVCWWRRSGSGHWAYRPANYRRLPAGPTIITSGCRSTWWPAARAAAWRRWSPRRWSRRRSAAYTCTARLPR
jgi:hypothetical protein